MKENKKLLLGLFASSSNKIEKDYFIESQKVAEIFAKKGFSLIYGGGNIGIMKAFADIFHLYRRDIISVITEKLDKFGVGYKEASSEYIITKDLYQRKKVIIEKSDIILVMPGGIGTIDELFEALAQKQLNYINKPIIIYNYKNYFSPIIEMFNKMIKEKFAYYSLNNLYILISNPSELDYFLEEVFFSSSK